MIAHESRLHIGRSPLEEPAHVRWVKGEQPIELGEGPIVLAHADGERRRAVDQLGVVGRERGRAVVERARLVEFAHELGHGGPHGLRACRRRRRVRRASRQAERLRVAAGVERRLRPVEVASRRRRAVLSRVNRRDPERQRHRRRDGSYCTDRHRALNGVGPRRASRPYWASRNRRASSRPGSSCTATWSSRRPSVWRPILRRSHPTCA